MEELNPVTPVTVHLLATAKLPVSVPDTHDVIKSDSMVAHAGSQHESEGNKENYSPNIVQIQSHLSNEKDELVLVPDEECFGYSLITINPRQYVHQNNLYDRLVAEKRCPFEVRILFILRCNNTHLLITKLIAVSCTFMCTIFC